MYSAYHKYSPPWMFYPFIAFINQSWSIKFGFFNTKIYWKKLFNVKVKTDFYKVMLIKENYIKKNNCLHNYSPPSSQYLVDAPLAAITAVSLCG